VAISVGGAVGAGFNLIGRRPLAVIAWGLFLVVAVVIIEILAFLLFGVQTAATTLGVTPSPAMLLTLVEQSAARTLFVIALELPVTAIVTGAVMRAVLEPDHRGFASMRFGDQEGALVLLFLLYIPIWIGVMVVSFIAVGACLLLGGLLARFSGALGGLVSALLIIGYCLGLMWVSLRFSMAAPMTFADHRVRFLSSWEATRGEGWRLFGLAWLLVLIGIGVGLALLIVFGILMALVFGVALGAAGGAQAFQSNPVGALATLGPLMLLLLLFGLAIYGVVIGCLQAIFGAPWAEVYRQLKGSPDVAATFS